MVHIMVKGIKGATMGDVSPFIDTVDGRAYFYKTEVEDKNGRWYNDYWIRDGFWVIHEGNQHHVYKIRKRGEW